MKRKKIRIVLVALLLVVLAALPALAMEEEAVQAVVDIPAIASTHDVDHAPTGARADSPEGAPPTTADSEKPEAAPLPTEGEVPPPPGLDAEEQPDDAPDEGTQDVGRDPVVEDDQDVAIHTVLFIGPNKAILETQQIEDGKRAIEPDDPAAPQGHVFEHWYDDAGDGRPFEFTARITCDMKIRARYDAIGSAQADAFEANENEAPTPVPELPDGETEPVDPEYKPESVDRGYGPESVDPEYIPESVSLEEDQTEVFSGPPRVEVAYRYDGDVLLEGTRVTLTANLYNIPEGTNLSFQWQNNATGRFEDVTGATNQTHTFYADAANSGCQWRVKVEGRDA